MILEGVDDDIVYFVLAVVIMVAYAILYSHRQRQVPIIDPRHQASVNGAREARGE